MVNLLSEYGAGVGLSYEFVGDICILNLGEELKGKAKEIGEKLLDGAVKTVVVRSGERHGEFRLQKYEHVCGERKFETIHKENGVKVGVDISKVYFSPRLASERLRIAKCVLGGERVLVMFCGCGVYNLVIGRHSKASLIVGVEKNPDGIYFCERNRKLNNLFDLKFVLGDANVVEFGEKFDRIVMPLPKNAVDFLDAALGCLAEDGVIHFYDFCEKGAEEEVWSRIEAKAGKVERLNFVYCGGYSPGKFRICAEFRVSQAL